MKKELEIDGKKISYYEQGSGSTIVLLHGFIESGQIWNSFAARLAEQFKVVVIDLPGHGESEVLAEVHSMDLMADIVNKVLLQEGIVAAVVVGHSMGGYVALEFARKYPEQLKGIVLFHSQASPDSEEARENRRRTINIVRQNRAGFIKQFIPDLFDQRYVGNYQEEIAGLLEEASKMSPEGIIAAISGMKDRKGGLIFLMNTDKPVLFIIGKQDSRIPYSQVLAQAVIPAHSEVLLLDHVGHMGYIEAPQITLQAIRHFAMKCYESIA
ncbi:MAG: alpha/beta hydrolase [Bacteroidales bacterium]|nr:alpha/beta hydrolase [Bacteroidales bacterium]